MNFIQTLFFFSIILVIDHVAGFLIPVPSQTLIASENRLCAPRYSTLIQDMNDQNTVTKSRQSSMIMGTETLIIPMMDDTRVKVRFHPSQFQELATKTNELISSFKALQTAEKMGKVGHKEAEMEYRFESEKEGDFTKLEIECNPNIYPDALHAKLFLKISTNSVEITSECMVTALIDALKSYKATYNLKLENSQ